MKWECPIRGAEHDEVPLCFGIEAPWRALVPAAEFEGRVELTKDHWVVDGSTFFVRGHIEVPIHEYPEMLAFSVWSLLNEKSFRHMTQRWSAPERDRDPPYFGWLCSPIPIYPSTIHLKLSVQSRTLGLVPRFTVEPNGHRLAVDQRSGITMAKWHEYAHALLDSSSTRF